jgi:ferric-chelate reductase
VLVLVPRNSILTFLCGVAFERAIRLHKWIGFLALGPILIHGFNYGLLGIGDAEGGDDDDDDDDRRRRLDGDEEDMVASGTVATLLYAGLFVLALGPVRRYLWEVFHIVHAVLAVALVVASVIHTGSTIIYFVPGAILVGADWLFRTMLIARGAAEIASVKTFGDVTHITLRTKSAPKACHGGQYMFVNFPKASWAQYHPLSNASRPGDPMVTLCIKNSGRWSSRVQSLSVGDAARLEGPYGLPGVAYRQYERVVLLCGGVGVTAMMSIALDLQQQREGEGEGEVVPTSVHFHWTARSVDCFAAFASEICDLREAVTASGRAELADAKKAVATPNFVVRLYCSRKGTSADLELPLQVESQRVDIPGALEQAAAAQGRGPIAVLCCGPESLVAAAQSACLKQSRGGLEYHFHSEEFNF